MATVFCYCSCNCTIRVTLIVGNKIKRKGKVNCCGTFIFFSASIRLVCVVSTAKNCNNEYVSLPFLLLLQHSASIVIQQRIIISLYSQLAVSIMPVIFFLFFFYFSSFFSFFFVILQGTNSSHFRFCLLELLSGYF